MIRTADPMAHRARVLFAVLLLFFTALVARTGYIQVWLGEEYADRARAQHFREIEFENEEPVILWLESQRRRVLVNPRIAFGHPIIASKGIRTEILFERFESGESLAEIATEFAIEDADVEEAIRWETKKAA